MLSHGQQGAGVARAVCQVGKETTRSHVCRDQKGCGRGVSLTSLSFIRCKDRSSFKLSHFSKCISVWYPTFNRTVVTFDPSLSVDTPLKAHPAWVLGLMSVTGHLLLLAPEEDMFWMFALMMDVHRQCVLSTNIVQIEIDASLFRKATEAINPMLTKKFYMQLSIAPARIMRPW